MPRQGPRPQCWKVQGEIPHQQYLAWLQMKAQAMYRRETFALSFEEFQLLWIDKWNMKGRGKDNYCLTREDPNGAWIWGNVICLPRIEHLRRQKLYKTEKMANEKTANLGS
ncbi:hypothetical protein UFOVP322_26 [uncultured Caudovirales phage]|uniref:Uncharacterized protein n=1 Tax=uncultured Caudovirales phage TaxID=2100421 RepID=A0A6J5LW43_9CAUD|nr:hypothetical protein UFOVP322_26 [uncultured Caudovirales phage]CAB4160902.1 hypothetical protein UFOVP771_24 [uncultured Caudovirales phage]CAB4166330.1 hypothetical protein UFOVP850_24 [uncultured Caudovirales phage]